MGKRRKRRPSRPEATELTGIARLLSETPVATLDLHGHTAEQARRRVRDFLFTQARVSSGRVVGIVTGKGLGSEGAPVLIGVVREMLDAELADLVAESAGLVGGGGWVVRMR